MKRIPIIDFVRFASVFIVIGGHFYPRWVVSFIHIDILRQIILIPFLNGPYGVTCFFVVSGFLITQMLVESTPDFSKIDIKAFYVRRAARIFPLLLVIILTGLLMEHAVGLLDERIQRYDAWNDATGFGWLFWASLLSFHFNWYAISHHAGIGAHWQVLWSLAIEEQFYLGYPWILKFLGERKKVLVFLFAVILSGLVFRFWVSPGFDKNNFLMLQGSPGSFDQIAIGALLYFVNERFGQRLSHCPGTALWIVFLGAASMIGCCAETSVLNGSQLITAPTWMALSCALVIGGGFHSPVFNSKAARWLSWPGKLSYGCYLWHSTIIVLLMPVLASLGGLGGLAYLILAVVFFSYLSYRFFETPVNHWVRSRFDLKPSSTG